jgi:hypothetical protein
MFVAVLVVFFCISAGNKGPSFPKELYVEPDPENPWTGTWYAMGGIKAMHVIQGMDGVCYIYPQSAGLFSHLILDKWKKFAVYTIEKHDEGYVTSNNWPISVNGNFLTVETMVYERVIENK